jgi:hypothetical protein
LIGKKAGIFALFQFVIESIASLSLLLEEKVSTQGSEASDAVDG